MPKKLDDHVAEMRAFGEYLVRYNFPLVDMSEEEYIGLLKSRELVVDGYEVVVVYNKADYTTHYLESCQILGCHAPFIPFCVICKIAKKFLGDEHLSLVELFRDNRKIYCWSVSKDRDGKAIPHAQEVESEPCNYEGFKYIYMNPKQVNFY